MNSTKEQNPDTFASSNSPQENWLSSAVKKRYGFMMVFLLSFWSLLGFVPVFESLLVNGLLLDTYVQLAFLTLVNFVAFVFCVSTIRLINRRVGGQLLNRLFGDGTQAWTPMLFMITSALALITPVVLASFSYSEFESSFTAYFIFCVAALLIGGALGWLVLWVMGKLKSQLFGSNQEDGFIFPFETIGKSGFLNSFAWIASVEKWLKGIGKLIGLENADFQLMAYLLIQVAIHVSAAITFSSSNVWWTSAPTMIITLIWITSMLLAGIANIFDQYRLPVVAIIVVMFSIWLAFQGSTRPIQTTTDDSTSQFVIKVAELAEAENKFYDPRAERTREQAKNIESKTQALHDTAWAAIENRMERVPRDSQKGKTLVVATCPGGGIHAAAWAACVLDQLSAEFDHFADSLCVISGVSGGSVGSLCFVSTQYEQQLLGELDPTASKSPSTSQKNANQKLKKFNPSLELATRSSLEEIAYGIATDDLYKTIVPWLPVPGRGQRLENGLMLRQPEALQSLTMGAWGDQALLGLAPVVIFNSTDAVTGRRILFDTIPTPRRENNFGLISRPLNYRELLQVYDADKKLSPVDVRPATAARTSATFPYVSPFTKPLQASPRGEAVAMCDGGYADNEGIVTAVNWIDFMLRRWTPLSKEDQPFDRILLIRIEPSAKANLNTIPDPNGISGWIRWLVGPAETMFNVRSASQSERGNLESDLAALYLEIKGKSSDVDSNNALPQDALKLTKPKSDIKYSPNYKNITAVQEFNWSDKSTTKKIRQQWDEAIGDLQEEISKDPSKSPFDETAAVQGTFQENADFSTVEAGNNENEKQDFPVVVQRIQFQNGGQFGDSIPLNWKLSKIQKLGYTKTWHEIVAPDVRKEISKYFNRRSVQTKADDK